MNQLIVEGGHESSSLNRPHTSAHIPCPQRELVSQSTACQRRRCFVILLEFPAQGILRIGLVCPATESDLRTGHPTTEGALRIGNLILDLFVFLY